MKTRSTINKYKLNKKNTYKQSNFATIPAISSCVDSPQLEDTELVYFEPYQILIPKNQLIIPYNPNVASYMSDHQNHGIIFMYIKYR